MPYVGSCQHYNYHHHHNHRHHHHHCHNQQEQCQTTTFGERWHQAVGFPHKARRVFLFFGPSENNLVAATMLVFPQRSVSKAELNVEMEELLLSKGTCRGPYCWVRGWRRHVAQGMNERASKAEMCLLKVQTSLWLFTAVYDLQSDRAVISQFSLIDTIVVLPSVCKTVFCLSYARCHWVVGLVGAYRICANMWAVWGRAGPV